MLALFNAATLHHADGQFGTTSASLIATQRFVFLVPHSATVVPLVVNWLPSTQQMGPTPEQLQNALQQMLADPSTTTANVEQWLSQNLGPGSVVELARCKTYKVETGLSRGFYYKPAGALTYDSLTLESQAAGQLAAFLPSPEAARAANPAAANAPPDAQLELREVPNAKLVGMLWIGAGVVIYLGGFAIAVTVMPGIVVALGCLFGPMLAFGGFYRVIKGQQVDLRTGKPPKSWQTGNGLTILAGLVLGLILIYPTILVAASTYQSLHGIEVDDEDESAPAVAPDQPAPEKSPRKRGGRRKPVPR
jgi:hypothetical protein